MFAKTPPPPYYIVTFTSKRKADDHGYANMAEHMATLSAQQPGFLGVESVRDSNGFGITNSYWTDAASIKAWKSNLEHLAAQNLGKTDWYEAYLVRVAKVERDYGFESKKS